jgi:hypothetical protein
MSCGKRAPMLRFATVAVAAAVLAGCGTPTIVPGEASMAYSPLHASAALGGRQTPVIVYGSPFAGVDPNTLSPIVALALPHAAPMIDTQFVPFPAGGERPEYSIVMAFNTAANISPRSLCDQNIRVPFDPTHRPIQLQAVFCGPGALTTSTGWLSDASGPQDPEFQNLAFGVTHTLFPDRSPHDDAWRHWW